MTPRIASGQNNSLSNGLKLAPRSALQIDAPPRYQYVELAEDTNNMYLILKQNSVADREKQIVRRQLTW